MSSVLLAILGGVGFIVGMIAWSMRRASATKRIQEFDDGTRCIVCHKTNMQIVGTQARCNDCLHISDLSALQAGVVDEYAIREATSTTSHRDL